MKNFYIAFLVLLGMPFTVFSAMSVGQGGAGVLVPEGGARGSDGIFVGSGDLDRKKAVEDKEEEEKELQKQLVEPQLRELKDPKECIKKLDYKALVKANLKLNGLPQDTTALLTCCARWLVDKQETEPNARKILSYLIEHASAIKPDIFRVILCHSGTSNKRRFLLLKKHKNQDLCQEAWNSINEVSFQGGSIADKRIKGSEFLYRMFDNYLVADIRRGADKAFLINTDAVGKKGKTPLLFAVQIRDDYMVRKLVARGADVNRRYKDGYTALMYAAWHNQYDDDSDDDDRENIVRILLRAGAAVGLKTESGFAALNFALQNPDKNRRVIDLLEQAQREQQNKPQEKFVERDQKEGDAEVKEKQQIKREQEIDKERFARKRVSFYNRAEQECLARLQEKHRMQRGRQRREEEEGSESEEEEDLLDLSQLDEGGIDRSSVDQAELGDSSNGEDVSLGSVAVIGTAVVGGCVAIGAIISKYFPIQWQKIKWLWCWKSKPIREDKRKNVVKVVGKKYTELV